MRTYRDISRNLILGVWNSPTSFLREAEDYISATNFDKYRYGTRQSEITSDANFYGYNPNSSLSLDQQYSYDELTKFGDPQLLSNAINGFSDISQKIDFGGNLEKSKLKFTSIPQGIFNFGLASKGLYRPIEYYSTEDKMVIDSDLVEKSEFNGKSFFFYYNKEGNQVNVRIQQEGSYLVEKNCLGVTIQYDNNPKMFIPFKDGLPFIGCGKIDKETNKPSKLRFATTTKKVYMYREKLGGGIQPYVDLFIVVGGLLDMTRESMLIKNLPLLIISQKLNEAGIKTRILAKRAYTINTEIVDYSFVIKDYGESLDINQIASFTSDPRFFRVTLWNSVPALINKKTGKTLDGYGTTLYGRRSPNISDDLIPTFNMFRNWALNENVNAVKSSKVSDPRLMILGGIGDISGADTLNNPDSVKKVVDEIYRIGDYVSLMFSKKPRKTISNIWERERERQRNLNPNDLNIYLKNYLTQTILDNLVTIDKNQVDNPVYATNPELIEEIEEQRIELLDTLREFINKP
jgi:hypothetical protein